MISGAGAVGPDGPQSGRLGRGADPLPGRADKVSSNIPVRLGIGMTLERLGRLAEAKTAYRRVVEVDPENLGARSGLERILAQPACERAEGPEPAPTSGEQADMTTGP